VPDDRFRAGRATVLKTFLRRPHLYRVVPLDTAQAHRNLRRELTTL
jgi:predicted metal-dependent HD superfamily phosphohydrolase